ncbi:MAG: response regulator [Gammaproteobacteria bacterium]|nr:response regulator [Gammaproteobacteria bacterium]
MTDEKPLTAANYRNALLIDDNLSDLRLLMEVMKHRHFRLHIATDGQDGFHKAQLLKPDLILLDVMMPKLDGFATLRLLKSHELTRHIPVIFLSAATESEKRIEGLKLGAVDFISKPFVEEEVVVRCEIHLHLAKQLTGLTIAESANQALSSIVMNSREQSIVNATMKYVRENLQQLPSLEVLAKYVGCNPKKLNLLFHEATGVTVFAWAREERLCQARSLLAHTEASISSIAAHLGYSSQANFAKAFHERFGCSAREYRDALLENTTTTGASKT